MYANQPNIGHVVEIFESLLTLKQGDISLQAHFDRLQALIQEVDLYQLPTTDLVTLKRYRAAGARRIIFYVACPHWGKQNHLANKCWKHVGKPPTAQAVMTHSTPFYVAPPSIHAPQYHVTLTLAEYDALCCSASIDASSSTSLALLLAPSTSSTFALLASSSPSWIIDSGASSHMTRTSSLLSSYHSTLSHLPVTIVDGQPCMVQGCGTTRVTPFYFSLPNPLCSWFPCKSSLH